MYITKDNRQFIIRKAKENDAQAIIDYAKTLFVSTDQVLTTLEEYTITLEQERKWINDSLQNSDAVILVVEMENKIVGLLDFFPKTKIKNQHTGEFGISIHPRFQGIGIGRQFLEHLIQWARENKKNEKLILNVLDTNKNAIHLYKSFGFKEEGRHVKAIKQLTGQYVDSIQMYLHTK